MLHDWVSLYVVSVVHCKRRKDVKVRKCRKFEEEEQIVAFWGEMWFMLFIYMSIESFPLAKLNWPVGC